MRAAVGGREARDDNRCEPNGIDRDTTRVEIGAECQGCQCSGGGETYCGGYPPRDKPRTGVIDFSEKVIFTARPGQSRPEFRIAQGTAKCRNTPHQPQHQDDRSRLDFDQLKAEACEYAGTHHVGDDHCGGDFWGVV